MGPWGELSILFSFTFVYIHMDILNWDIFPPDALCLY